MFQTSVGRRSPQRGDGDRRRRASAAMIAALAASTLAASGCGSSERNAAAPSPQAGVWLIDGLAVDGNRLDLQGAQMTVEFDDAASSVRIRTSCNVLLGSFTFGGNSTDTAGPASLTVPGTTGNECDPGSAALDAEVLRLMEAVDAWQQRHERFSLLVEGATVVELQPVD